VIHVLSGKGKGMIVALKEHPTSKGVGAAQIEEVSMELSLAYIAGVPQYPELHQYDLFSVQQTKFSCPPYFT
jgi:hypothetical protein